MVPAGTARSGCPHRPSPAARGAAARGAPWRAPGRDGQGPGAGGDCSTAPFRAVGAGSAAGQGSCASGQPVAETAGDRDDGRGPGPGGLAGGSCDRDTRAPPGRAGAGRGRGPGQARPLRTPLPSSPRRGTGDPRAMPKEGAGHELWESLYCMGFGGTLQGLVPGGTTSGPATGLGEDASAWLCCASCSSLAFLALQDRASAWAGEPSRGWGSG